MKDRLTHILADEIRKEAEEKDWEDVRFSSDAEISMMYPETETDRLALAYMDNVEAPPNYSADDYLRLLELDQELAELLESIRQGEDTLKSGSNSSIYRSELLSDLKNERLKQARILQEMAEIKRKYERNIGPIR